MSDTPKRHWFLAGAAACARAGQRAARAGTLAEVDCRECLAALARPATTKQLARVLRAHGRRERDKARAKLRAMIEAPR